ncbi:MAG: ATP-dependent DNA helicase [Clostridia bacterium]|nr:ATP-dependent DNA helicase [Clostridia bacterium]
MRKLRYDEENSVILLPLGEFIAISLHRFASETANEREQNALKSPPKSYRPLGIGERREFSYPFSEGGHRFLLQGSADGLTEPPVGLTGTLPCLTVLKETSGDPQNPDRDTLRRVRGEAFLLAFLYMTSTSPAKTVRTKIYLRNPLRDTEAIIEETVTRTASEAFFARLCTTLGKRAGEEIDRVSRRLPTLNKLPFPYRGRRAAQEEMIQAAYRAIRQGRRLYACAPTGTGKTAAALYPALRALGAGICDRVFYLTPKTTTARAAADTLARFARAGGRLRAVCLSAKERLCTQKMACRELPSPCRFSRAGGEREEQAAEALLALQAVPITEREIGEVAAKFGVCPYELSLRYSLFCDVIIGDYNYLFDTRVYLRRYFDEPGRYCVLVDEAHDLVERAREMYSGSLTLSALTNMATLCREQAPLSELAAKASEARTLFLRLLKGSLHGERQYEDGDGIKHAFAASRTAPDALTDSVRALAEEGLRTACDRRVPLALRDKLRHACYPLRDFADRAELYSNRFETFYMQDGEEYTLRTVCLDPADMIDRRLSLCESAVLFSATLTPLDYYRAVLGGRDGEELLLDSPFEEEHLCVAVMDKVSTRFTARTESAPSIAAAIHAMVAAKTGNYFVFCPSFSYMEEVARAYHQLYPQVRLALQKRGASTRAREEFLSQFAAEPKETLVGFCVTGGVFAEGIDLAGSRLIGAAVVGVGIPQPSPEREAMCAYYQDVYEQGKQFAYFYPGMNRVLQAAGRVIRTEEDYGTLLLIDDRFGDPLYRTLIPRHWRHLKLAGDAASAGTLFRRFWREVSAENKQTTED